MAVDWVAKRAAPKAGTMAALTAEWMVGNSAASKESHWVARWVVQRAVCWVAQTELSSAANLVCWKAVAWAAPKVGCLADLRAVQMVGSMGATMVGRWVALMVAHWAGYWVLKTAVYSAESRNDWKAAL